MDTRITAGAETGNDFAKTPLILSELKKTLEDLGVHNVLLVIAEDFGGEATEEQILNSPRLAPIGALLAVIELCQTYEGRYHEGLFINALTKAMNEELKDMVKMSELDEAK